MAALGRQLHLLAQGVHRGGAGTEASQDADLHRNAPGARLDQGRLVQIPAVAGDRIGVVLHHQVVDQPAQGPELPVLQPLVVGEAEGAGREADHQLAGARDLLKPEAQLPQQAGELLAAPAHPKAVVGIGGRILAGFGPVEGPGGVVVAQLRRPGEVIVQLDAIHIAALHDLEDQTDEAGPHAGMGRIEPHPQVPQGRGGQVGAVHGEQGTAIGPAQQPFGVLAHHLRIARFHQAVLEPGHHLHAAAPGGLGEGADRIEVGVQPGQGGFHRRPAAAVEGGTAAPDVGVKGVEAGGGEGIHGGADPAGVVVQGAGAVGEPYPHPRLGQPAGGFRRPCPVTAAGEGAHQLQQGGHRQGEPHRQQPLEVGPAPEGRQRRRGSGGVGLGQGHALISGTSSSPSSPDGCARSPRRACWPPRAPAAGGNDAPATGGCCW